MQHSLQRSLRASVWGGALSILAMAACGDSPEAERLEREAADAWAALRAYTVEQKDAFVRAVNDMTADLDGQVEELRVRSASASAEARADWDRVMQDLERKRQELAMRIDAAGAATAETWEEARSRVAEAYEDFRRALEDALD